MKKNLKCQLLNLTQFIVYYDEPNCCNAVVAVGHKDKDVIIIRPEYRLIAGDILDAVHNVLHKSRNINVLYGDGFHADTWDNKIAKHEARPDVIVNDVAPDLFDALTNLLEKYTDLVNSGDAGFWDCENDSEVIQARAALAKAIKK